MEDNEYPDVELRAFIRAERLRFEEAPRRIEVSIPDDRDEDLELAAEPESPRDHDAFRWWDPAWRRSDDG